MKKRRLKTWVKETLVGLLIIGVIVIFIILSNSLEKDENNHIIQVSKECSIEGKGIVPYYTKQGDKFWRCAK